MNKLESSGRYPPYFWRNYMAHTFEGAIYIGGIAFVSIHTIMPPIIESLGGPSWLVSLMPVMLSLGFVAPPLFTAHWIERLSWYKPLIMGVSFFQRLPYLMAALFLFFLSDAKPGLTVYVVAFSPFLSGLLGGVTMTAWQSLVAKTIPTHRRASLWATRNIISSLIGIGAGAAIAAILHRYPGLPGYGILHLIAFGFLMVSYVVFATIRETEKEDLAGKAALGFTQNLRRIPAILRNDRRLSNYLGSCAGMMMMFVAIPYLSIRALQVTGKPESALGFFVAGQMAGAMIGNVVAGYVGDRTGAKRVLLLGRITFLAMFALSLMARSEWAFVAVYVLFGFAFNFNMVGNLTLSVEISNNAHRATSLALIAGISVPAMLLASLLSTLLRGFPRGFEMQAGVSLVGTLISLLFLLRIAEPRKETTT